MAVVLQRKACLSRALLFSSGLPAQPTFRAVWPTRLGGHCPATSWLHSQAPDRLEDETFRELSSAVRALPSSERGEMIPGTLAQAFWGGLEAGFAGRCVGLDDSGSTCPGPLGRPESWICWQVRWIR